MFRTLLMLLIATMLACPVRCNAHAGGGCDEGQVGASGGSVCQCCRASTDESPSESPVEAPSEDCECGNCICHGAVLESDSHFLFTSVLSIAPLPGFEFELPVSLAVQASSDFWDAERGLYTTGRDARIAHQSLLI